MNNIKLIVGLGNPGYKYEKNRHNQGALFVKKLASTHMVNMYVKMHFFGLVGKMFNKVYLLIPNTYMNESGKSVLAIARFYNIESTSILVAHDDINLQPGIIKIKKSSKYHTHNGVFNIITSLGYGNIFHCIRIGIGNPGKSSVLANYVLSDIMKIDQKKIDIRIHYILTNLLQSIISGNWPIIKQQLHSKQ